MVPINIPTIANAEMLKELPVSRSFSSFKETNKRFSGDNEVPTAS
jgi:hypothetical protein